MQVLLRTTLLAVLPLLALASPFLQYRQSDEDIPPPDEATLDVGYCLSSIDPTSTDGAAILDALGITDPPFGSIAVDCSWDISPGDVLAGVYPSGSILVCISGAAEPVPDVGSVTLGCQPLFAPDDESEQEPLSP